MDIAERRTANPDHWNLASAIRVLSMDAVEAANSGHPGMPMGMADVAEGRCPSHPGGNAALSMRKELV